MSVNTGFTHQRGDYSCDGHLTEIPDPPWFHRGHGHNRFIVFARCEHCDMAGEIMDPLWSWRQKVR